MSTFPIEVYQFDPTAADVAGNVARIADRAARSEASLLITPELSLTGYDIGEQAAALARPVRTGQTIAATEPLADVEPAVVIGLPEVDVDGNVYNTLAVVERGTVRFRHRKVYLPTYGMFDEARFFARGSLAEPFTIDGWRVGFLVCEDFWHPGLAWVLAVSGIDLLVVISAAPGRDGLSADGADGFASMEAWERIARTTAQVYGIWVVLANRCGVEGPVTYAGGSIVASPDGGVVSRAPAFEPATVVVELTRDAIERARRPASHARDEDVRLMRELLDRIDD